MQNEEINTVPVETADSLRSKGWRPKGEVARIYSDPAPVSQLATTENYITMALNGGRSMDDIRDLIKMRNEEIQRIARLQFFEAMSVFQELVPPITRNKNVSFDHKDGSGKTEYEYATLGNTKRTIAPAARECGLSYEWKTRYEGDYIYIRCIISHVGGHSEYDELRGLADKTGKKNDIQSMKSTISYLRRGTLESVFGLAVEGDGEDDDGRSSPRARKVSKLDTLDAARFNTAMKEVREGGVTVEELQERYTLTEDQLKALQKVQKS